MHPVLATLECHCDGVLTGLFRSLLIRTHIELRPKSSDGPRRTYHAIALPDFVLGEGEQRCDPVNSPIDLVLWAPELAGPIQARAVHRGCDRWDLLWIRR